jgi:hypothetical protein
LISLNRIASALTEYFVARIGITRLVSPSFASFRKVLQERTSRHQQRGGEHVGPPLAWRSRFIRISGLPKIHECVLLRTEKKMPDFMRNGEALTNERLLAVYSDGGCPILAQ